MAQLPLDAETGEPLGQELATIGTTTYVAIPDDAILPLQEDGIVLEPVDLTSKLRDQIKAASWQCQRIEQLMQERIRARYSVEDELFLQRIKLGNVSGMYEFQPGEEQEIDTAMMFLESVREWGRGERAKLGL